MKFVHELIFNSYCKSERIRNLMELASQTPPIIFGKDSVTKQSHHKNDHKQYTAVADVTYA